MRLREPKEVLAKRKPVVEAGEAVTSG
jgi:hypothetical protein